MNNTQKLILGGGVVALAVIVGPTLLGGNKSPDSDFLGGGGGGYALGGGGENPDPFGDLIRAFQQSQQPAFENPFQNVMDAATGKNTYGYLKDLALSNGFSGTQDPLFKAAFLETQLSKNVPDGMYAVNVPYAPTAVGAAAQIAATKSGGSGTGKATIKQPTMGQGGYAPANNAYGFTVNGKTGPYVAPKTVIPSGKLTFSAVK